jgi:disulfide bond formation protein DsbB
MPMPLLAALLAAAAPLFARASEALWDLAPCALCLWQRWPYWVAAGLALGAWALPGQRRRLLALAGLAVLASAGVAGLHVGVEFGWWPSPLPGCQAPALAPGADLFSALPLRPNKPCDAPAFLIPALPLSMAAMNLIYAAALGAWILRKATHR